MNLYQISRLATDTLNSAIDTETGEILNEDLLARLEQLTSSREDITLDLACEVKNLLSTAGQIKTEMDALRERKARLESKAESIKRTIAKFSPGFKGEDGRVKISWRSSSSVEVTNLDLLREAHPELVHRVEEFKPDKGAIKEALKTTQVEGAEMVERTNLQIK